MKQQLICIVCPKGCHLTAEQTAVQCQAGDMIMTEDGHPVVIEDQVEIED